MTENQPMNIFYLDPDPRACAQAHCDTHVVKMVLETAQLLSTAWHVLHNPLCLKEGDPAALPVFVSMLRPLRASEPPAQADGPLPAARVAPLHQKVWLLAGQRIYTKTHETHPCARWAAATAGNYAWLWRLGMELSAEYSHRYGRTHATQAVLRTLEAVPPALAGGFEAPPQCMPEEFRRATPLAGYRAYYGGGKAHLLEYTNREVPVWLEEVCVA